MTEYLSLIICITGLVVYAVCHNREKVPAFIAPLALIAFGVGLGAWLVGK